MSAPAHWRGQRLAAVLFDLDGTLFDTADDIALALNRATADFGWEPIAAGVVRRLIGRGAPQLLRRAAQVLGRDADAATYAAMLERFFHHYAELERRAESTAPPFQGALEAVRQLHAAGLKIAVVTNKQRRFADALVRSGGLCASVDLIVGGDTCERRKPHPEPLLYACAALEAPLAAALMVGDSSNDVEAARAAGIPVICVPYGYDEGRDPRLLPGDALIESLAQLPAMLLMSQR